MPSINVVAGFHFFTMAAALSRFDRSHALNTIAASNLTSLPRVASDMIEARGVEADASLRNEARRNIHSAFRKDSSYNGLRGLLSEQWWWQAFAHDHFLRLVTAVNVGLMLTASMSITSWWSRGRDGETQTFFGIKSGMQLGLFVGYILLSCGHMFLQNKAGKTGYSVMAATVLVYLMKFCCSSLMLVSKGQGSDVPALFESSGKRFKSIPVFILPLIPGGMLAAYDTLSFLSLAELGPVTYQIFIHIRLVVVALVWQVTFQKRLSKLQMFALLLFACASICKALDQLQVVGVHAARGLLILACQVTLAAIGNVSAELLLKELPIPTDLLNACMYIEGLLCLLVGITVTMGPRAILDQLLLPRAWIKLGHDPWMIASICCLGVFGITTAYFLREFSNVTKEVSACFVIILAAIAEWGVLGLSICTPLGVQSLMLALFAVGVYNSDPLATRGKDPAHQAAKKSPA